MLPAYFDPPSLPCKACTEENRGYGSADPCLDCHSLLGCLYWLGQWCTKLADYNNWTRDLTGYTTTLVWWFGRRAPVSEIKVMLVIAGDTLNVWRYEVGLARNRQHGFSTMDSGIGWTRKVGLSVTLARPSQDTQLARNVSCDFKVLRRLSNSPHISKPRHQGSRQHSGLVLSNCPRVLCTTPRRINQEATSAREDIESSNLTHI